MPLKQNKLTTAEQEKLLERYNLFLGNRYRVSDKYRRLCEIPEEVTTVAIEEVWQMLHIGGNNSKSTMLHIRYNDGTSDHHPVEFIEDLLCQPFPKPFKK